MAETLRNQSGEITPSKKVRSKNNNNEPSFDDEYDHKILRELGITRGDQRSAGNGQKKPAMHPDQVRIELNRT